MLGIEVFFIFWRTHLLSTAKAVESVKRRYKPIYIDFALYRQDNEGDTTPRNTVGWGSVGDALLCGVVWEFKHELWQAAGRIVLTRRIFLLKNESCGVMRIFT